jgi:hypothetical protein
MRPYTGKYTLRKGWRMQDKRAVPGVTDYYVHDEDGRPVCRVDAPGTVIPNPARRRLEFSIRVSQEQEGKLRNKLARLEKGTPEHAEVESKLEEQLRLQAELMSQRPSLPKYAPVEETELSGELTYHEPHYKTVLDTIRIACLNAEAELAGELSEHMKKPAEAKKLLANIFAAPGDLRVGKKSVTLHLKFAARADERRAVAELFKIINKRNLTLPGDPKSRPLCFKSDI